MLHHFWELHRTVFRRRFSDKREYNSRPALVQCTWDVDAGGRDFIHAVSWGMTCLGVDEDDDPRKGEHGGFNCSGDPPVEGLENIRFPTHGHNISHSVIAALETLATAANGTATAANGTAEADEEEEEDDDWGADDDDDWDDDDSASCTALQDGMHDAASKVEMRSVEHGGGSFIIESRSDMKELYRRVFVDACECPADLCAHTGLGWAGPTKFAGAGKTCCDRDGQCQDCKDSPEQDKVLCSPLSGNVTAEFAFRRKTLLNAFITAYFRAGFLEELLKYLAVRRILFKDRVADAGGLLVYGLASAAGFASMENLEYVAGGGVGTAFGRMFLSVPLHCCTGIMIGVHLGYRKFLGAGHWVLDKFAVAMAMPVLVHGTYDFFLMIPLDTPGWDRLFGVLCSLCVLLIGFAYTRYAWLQIDNVCVVHVKDLQAAGRISNPQCCCCEADCCSETCRQEDPLLKNMPISQASPTSAGSGPDTEGEENSESNNNENNVIQRIGTEVFPQVPTCQTEEATCPGCGQSVRRHILYPSDCPFCAHQFPDPFPVVGTAVE